MASNRVGMDVAEFKGGDVGSQSRSVIVCLIAEGLSRCALWECPRFTRAAFKYIPAEFQLFRKLEEKVVPPPTAQFMHVKKRPGSSMD